jgi:hypothetical protein
MVKINTDAFKEVSQTASLNHDNTKFEVEEVRKNTSVYDIPIVWINAMKKHKFNVSSYIKQALFEKLRNDGLL